MREVFHGRPWVKGINMRYAAPGQPGSIVSVQQRYENFIGGKWLAPAQGKYRTDLAPATAAPITEVAQSTPEDVELALDAAHAAKDGWAEKSPTERAAVLNAIADAIEANKEMLAVAESWENGKPVRETLNADVPLVVDHFRYFAAAARAEEGTSTEIDKDMVAYHFREPLGVVGQIIPFNFPLLMAAWKLAPALAAGNCSVLKPASPTPWSILKLAEVIEDIVPPGVINIVTGPGAEIGKALAANPRIAKIGFTGETVTGRLIMQYAAQNLIPSTVELGGKSPNIFFADVMAHDDEFLDKAVEGLVLYAFNKGEVCTAPSRALVHRDIYDEFMARALARIETMTQGNPLDTDTQLGAQVSAQQLEKIVSYVEIGRREGAEVLIGGERGQVGGDFTDVADALEIANDTLYGLGAGVWTRDGTRAYRMGRGIKAGRVWTNCYHQYPAGAAFGGYKISGIGRENHRMMAGFLSDVRTRRVHGALGRAGHVAHPQILDPDQVEAPGEVGGELAHPVLAGVGPALRPDPGRGPAGAQHDPLGQGHRGRAGYERSAESRPEPRHPGQGLGRAGDPAGAEGPRPGGEGQRCVHVAAVPRLRVHRGGVAREPSALRLPVLRPHRARRPERGSQHRGGTRRDCAGRPGGGRAGEP